MSDDLEGVRAKLAARRDACFDRIDDAVSELLALHRVEGDEIRASVDASILRHEHRGDESPASG